MKPDATFLRRRPPPASNSLAISQSLPPDKPRAAFTLLEVLVALALLAMAMAIAFGTFYSITRAWQRGTAMAENLNRGEFVMEEIARALRSAFYPLPASNRTDNAGGDFGFWLEDNGDAAKAHDSFSWVKAGDALLPPDSPFQRGLHRVMLSVEENDADRQTVLAARAWRPYTSILEDFKPQNEPPFYIAKQVVGLNCQVATNLADDGWEWLDRWENELTNTLPTAVKITLYLTPLEPGDDPVELQRTVVIPVAPLSQAPRPTAPHERPERPPHEMP